MSRSLTLPTVAILVLAGTGLGVHLGKASIAEINPAYFSEPPTRFHADLSPYQRHGYTGLSAPTGTSMVALGEDCVGCRTYPEEYYPIHDPAVDGFGASDLEVHDPLSLAEQQSNQEPKPGDAALVLIERYASFPVSAEEAEARASAEVDYGPADYRGETALD